MKSYMHWKLDYGPSGLCRRTDVKYRLLVLWDDCDTKEDCGLFDTEELAWEAANCHLSKYDPFSREHVIFDVSEEEK